MLVLPVLLLAFTIAVGRLTHADQTTKSLASSVTPGAKRALMGLPPIATPVQERTPQDIIIAATAALESTIPPGASTVPALAVPATVPPFDRLTAVTEQQNLSVTAAAPPPAITPAAPADLITPRDPPAAKLTARSGRPAETAPAAPLSPNPLTPPPTRELAAVGDPGIATPAWDLPGGMEALATGLAQCRFDPAPPRTPLPPVWTAGDPDSFGLALATAARRQLDEFVIYNDRYTRMKYPMGDVHPMYGVCTDVVIRAYRILGIDLQEMVQKTKTGSGDPNIDHRRVDTLRKFFSRFGESLPISSFAEDYKPGDIVTYWRPQNRHSRTHIAVVSDMTGPSGRPLIIHNRGWGPQQEDGLFVDEITGHYRFSGLKAAATQALTEPKSKSVRPPAGSKQAAPRPIVRTGLAAPSPAQYGPRP